MSKFRKHLAIHVWLIVNHVNQYMANSHSCNYVLKSSVGAGTDMTIRAENVKNHVASVCVCVCVFLLR